MKNSIAITAEEFLIIKNILHKHLPLDAKVWVFGSRAKGTIKKSSDLDLVVDMGKPLTLKILANLDEDFTESILPYKVDVVDWNAISDPFKERIKEEHIQLAL